MAARGFGNAGRTLTVMALLSSVMLPVAVFVYSVLASGWVARSGPAVESNERAAFADDDGTYGQW
jgi:hypothetical protein